ncbi:MAG TPA: hypothetical protein VFG47_22855 [Geminicoccaceae bacterium]|nr:hypothetical protein [Geminicoccaceae bacterium]
MKRAVAVIALLGVLLAVAIATTVWAWRRVGEAEISGHGYVALVLGAVLAFAVGAGLMALVFFSSRRGYDEEAHRPAERAVRRDEGDRG